MKNLISSVSVAALVAVGFSGCTTLDCACKANSCACEQKVCSCPYGNWALYLPFDAMNAGHLILEKGADGAPEAKLLWRWASPTPTKNVKVEGSTFTVTRNFERPKGSENDPAKWRALCVKGTVKGCEAACEFMTVDGNGKPGEDLTPKYPLKVQAVWTPEGVVLGITCMEPTPDKLQKTHAAGDYWGNDNLEIFIDPTGDQEGVYGKIWVDCVNQMLVIPGKGGKWKPTGVKSGVKINADSWTVELYVPFSDAKFFDGAKIPGTQGGMNWNGNVTRLRIADAWQKDKAARTPGSVAEMQRLYTRFSNWNSDPNAFGEWKFVEQ